jgi:hypothetical protein
MGSEVKKIFLDKKVLLLIVIGLLVFGLRLGNLNESIYDDEFNHAYSLTVMDSLGYNHDYYSAVPFNLLYKPFIKFFGLTTNVFRFIPWLFGILNTVLVYLFARRLFNKNVAFFATLLMLFSFYSTLASLQFDVEGSLVMFSVLLLFFSLTEYYHTKFRKQKTFWQILAGIGLGLAIISKYNAVYLVLIIVIYAFFKRKWDIKQVIKDLFLICLSGFMLFVLYWVVGMLSDPNWINFLWVVGFDRYHNSGLYALAPLMYLLWATPLLIGFYVIAFFRKSKELLLFLLWITIPLLFYTLILPFGAMDRYFMMTIPALAILGGYFIEKVSLRKIHIIFGIVILFVFTSILFILNSKIIINLARIPSLYLEQLKNLNLDFLFVYTSSSGPTFGVNFLVIALSFFCAFLCLLLYLFYAKKPIGKYFFTLFLVISLSFNIFLVTEYLYHPTSVDVSEEKLKMIDFIIEKGLERPYYSTDSGLLWYFDNDRWGNKGNALVVPDNEIGADISYVKSYLIENGGTLMIVNWPPLPEKSPVKELIGYCELEKEFYNKNYLVGEVYIC